MTRYRIRHCEEAKLTKQSISAIRESKANCLLYANLWLGLSIRFSIIYFIYLLKTRVLDCHENATHFLAMTSEGSESVICLAMTKRLYLLIRFLVIAIHNLLTTRGLDSSLRALRYAQNDKFFNPQISLKGAKMVT